ncbi:hypothetical protein ACFUCV_06745 [Specibacter sp. NPDC057265]|uniref:hypothetical protein n=1 Tax=Specibacter sp. NPDC057265 TaxID=3346075 RepID=UPI00363EF753
MCVRTSEQTITVWTGLNGQQAGHPVKLSKALVTIAALEKPRLRIVAGAGAGVKARLSTKD